MTDRSDPSSKSRPPASPATAAPARTGAPAAADAMEPAAQPADENTVDVPAADGTGEPASDKRTPPPIAITAAELAAVKQPPQTRPAGELPVRGPEATPARGTPAGAGSETWSTVDEGTPRKATESQKIRIQTVDRMLQPKVTVTAHPSKENHEETPDEKLVLRSMDGDNRAFEELYRRYLSRAVVAAYAVVGQREKAQDVAQEAFIEAANKLATLREPENFGGWVCGISRRMAIVAIRKESRRLNAIRDHQEELREKPRHDEPDVAAVKDEQKALIRRAIQLVDAKYREILLLKYVEKLSYDEIASLCAISRAAVDKRLTRGKKILREKMEDLMGSEGGLM